jgi:hypothetical protein
LATAVEPLGFSLPRVRPLVVGAVASLSAGAVHAAAIGAHAEHRQAALLFTAVAAFQLAWGAVALTSAAADGSGRRRAVALVGALGNAALVAGWALAKTKGISWVNGLEEVEPVQFADALCAALAAVAAGGALISARRGGSPKLPPSLGSGLVVVLAAVSLPGMVQAGRHVHSHEHGGVDVSTVAAVVPPHPYDPTKPIDLSGVPGVTPQQQARAENLIAVTLLRLPQWADPAKAEAAGFHSIGDGITGYEHFLNPAFIADDDELDPDKPESLVYRVQNGQRTLEAAMYMAKPGTTLDNVPDIGGKLTQWHIHDNLCFTATPPQRVVGLTAPDGTCRAPFVKGPSIPMIHVWIVAKPCGPFAALEGVGGGQIKAGEERLCDHVHGSPA